MPNQSMSFQISGDEANNLSKWSELSGISKSQIVRDGIKLKINELKKRFPDKDNSAYLNR